MFVGFSGMATMVDARMVKVKQVWHMLYGETY